MSFTVFSAALLLLVAAGVLSAAMRGYRHGLAPTALTLSFTILSALAAVPLAVWLSDPLTLLLDGLLEEAIPGLSDYAEKFPNVEVIIPAAIDALISPLLFVVLFLLLRGAVGRPLTNLLCRVQALKPGESEDPAYESFYAPEHRRDGRLWGAVLGGIGGVAAALCLLSPFLGLLSAAGTALDAAQDIRVKWSAYGMTEEHVEVMESVAHDPVVQVLDAAGSGVIFDATATTTINDRRVSLRGEVEACADLLVDLMTSMNTLKDMNDIPPEQKETLAGLGDEISRSEVAKLVAADTVNLAAESWMNGKTFMKVPCPRFNQHLEPLMDSILGVLAHSEPDCVGRDLSTILDICLIASDSGLMQGNLTYTELAACLDRGGVIDAIYNEVLDNPCTAHLAGKMTEVAVRMMASAIEGADFDAKELKGLMTHLSDAMNRVNGMGISAAQRVEHMKEYTAYYAKMYGMNIPGSLAEIAAVAFVEKLGNTGSRITADQVFGLFEDYMK